MRAEVTASYRPLRISIKQPARTPHDHATLADVMVTAAGRLRCAPLLLAATRRYAAGDHQPPRRHTGIDIVTIVLHGSIVQLDTHVRHVLGPDDITVRSTGSGIEHAVLADATQPSAVLELWLPGRVDEPARHVRFTRPRGERLGCWSKLVALRDVTVSAIVLPVGATTVYRSVQRSYLLSTIGRIAIDGRTAQPDERVAVRGSGELRINALESTEIVAVTVG